MASGHSRQEKDKEPTLWNGNDFECSTASKRTRVAGEPSEQGRNYFGDMVRIQLVQDLLKPRKGIGLNSK